MQFLCRSKIGVKGQFLNLNIIENELELMILGFRRCNSRGQTDCNLQLLDRHTVPFHLVDFEYHKWIHQQAKNIQKVKSSSPIVAKAPFHGYSIRETARFPDRWSFIRPWMCSTSCYWLYAFQSNDDSWKFMIWVIQKF